MAAEDVEEFIGFLRENTVHAEVEPEVVVHSGGETYGYGRLIHLFDADSVSTVYRMWNQVHDSRISAGAPA
jgi:hypothetical protein